jgi:hypothetical protein
MKLEQVERNNRVHVRIPRGHVCCPSCGADDTGVIILDLETLTDERFQAMKHEDLFPAEQPLRCTDCGWEGTAFDVYQAALNVCQAVLRGEKRRGPVSVELTRKDLKVLKSALSNALLEYQAQAVAEEIGEGGNPERSEQWREKAQELRRVMRKLS